MYSDPKNLPFRLFTSPSPPNSTVLELHCMPVKRSLTLQTTEILAMRKAMWEKVSSRSHNPIKIFPFGSYSDEVMLHGTVKYGLKSGGESGLDWAARAHLVKVDGKVKMDFYQVYLVSRSYVLRFAAES
jgi:hypothetical protein